MMMMINKNPLGRVSAATVVLTALLMGSMAMCQDAEEVPKASVGDQKVQANSAEFRKFWRELDSLQAFDWQLACHGLIKRDPTGEKFLPFLAERLCSEHWPTVSRTRNIMFYYGRHAVPYLLRIARGEELVKLKEIQDLIYPGAHTFYGHGLIVDYDIDYLPARAGWVLEQLTFQDFGFRMNQISEGPLLGAAVQGIRDTPLRDVVPIKRSNRDEVSQAVEKAISWWKEVGPSWTRYRGIQEALSSGKKPRILEALSYVRLEGSPCPGLTPASYEREILPLVRPLATHGDAEIREQATLLLQDEEHWWWDWKDEEFLRQESEKFAEDDESP